MIYFFHKIKKCKKYNSQKIQRDNFKMKRLMGVIILQELNHFLDDIRKKIGHLTKTQKKVANYILENYQETSFLTIESLSTNIGVSTSSVMRCAYALGFSGYTELQNKLRSILKIQMYPPYEQLEKGHLSKDSLLNKILEKDIENIRKTAKGLQIKLLDKTISHIANAKRVYVIGLRGAYAIAYYLSNGLEQLTGKAELLSLGEGNIVEKITNTDQNDLLIVFSFPRYSKEAVKIAHFAKSNGLTVISITDSYKSPLLPSSDIL